MRFSLVWIAAALLAGAAHAQTGTLVRDADLKSEPFSDAATLASVPSQTKVEVLTRRGAWMQVKADGKQGWVRMLSVRLEGGRAAGSGGDADAIGRLLGFGGRQTGTTTVATGVRGLSEEDLKSARPNPAEVQKLDQQRASPDDARRFAAAARLEPRGIDYLDAAGEPVKGGQR